MNFFFKNFFCMALGCAFLLGCGDEVTSPDDGTYLLGVVQNPSSSDFVPTSSAEVAQISSATLGSIPSSSGVVENLISSSDEVVPMSSSVENTVLSSEVIMPLSSSSENLVSSSGGVMSSSSSSEISVKQGTFDSMFFGAWVGGPEETPQPTAANVAAFERLQDRHLDVISVFSLWQYNDWNWTRTYANIAKQNGSILLVTWMPTPYTAADILSGKCDSYIDDFARGVKDFGDEIWLRPLHEANGDWYTWGTGTDGVNNSSDKVAEAFRYIVKRFRAIDVPNVKWVWTTNASNSGAGSSLTGAYPGDEYVDYNSIDGYNWGAAQSWSSWQSFSSVFSKAYNALSAYDKPLFIAEFASSEKGGNKAEWINEMFRDLPTKFPKIIGLMWFSQSKENNEGDWALNTSDAAVEAWKKGISAYPQAKR